MKLRAMLKSKIHRATVTGTDFDYEGSISIDRELLVRADILANEQVHVLNLNSGARFVTYAIPARAGSGDVMLNGAAARLVSVGDKLILASYTAVAAEDVPGHKPTVILVGKDNHIKSVKEHEEAGVRVS